MNNIILLIIYAILIRGINKGMKPAMLGIIGNSTINSIPPMIIKAHL